MSFFLLDQFHFKLQNILRFNLYMCDTSTFLVKSWNLSFMVLQIKKPRNFLFNNLLAHYPFSLVLLRFGLFFFIHFFQSTEFPKILIVGSKSVSIKEYYNSQFLPSFARKVIFGFDDWFAGFFGIERDIDSYYNFSPRFRSVVADSYMVQSKKKLDRFIDQSLVFLTNPSFIFFLQIGRKTFFADHEVGIRLIPSISLISPESRAFGFSKMLYTIPFPFSKLDENFGLFFFHQSIFRLVLVLFKSHYAYKPSLLKQTTLFGANCSLFVVHFRRLQKSLTDFFFMSPRIRNVFKQESAESKKFNIINTVLSFLLSAHLIPIILHSVWVGDSQLSSSTSALTLFKNKYFYRFLTHMFKFISSFGFSLFKKGYHRRGYEGFFTHFDDTKLFTIRRLRAFHSLNLLQHYQNRLRPRYRFKIKVSTRVPTRSGSERLVTLKNIRSNVLNRLKFKKVENEIFKKLQQIQKQRTGPRKRFSHKV